MTSRMVELSRNNTIPCSTQRPLIHPATPRVRGGVCSVVPFPKVEENDTPPGRIQCVCDHSAPRTLAAIPSDRRRHRTPPVDCTMNLKGLLKHEPKPIPSPPTVQRQTSSSTPPLSPSNTAFFSVSSFPPPPPSRQRKPWCWSSRWQRRRRWPLPPALRNRMPSSVPSPSPHLSFPSPSSRRRKLWRWLSRWQKLWSWPPQWRKPGGLSSDNQHASLSPESRYASLSPESQHPSLSPESQHPSLPPDSRRASPSPERRRASLSPERRGASLSPERQHPPLSSESRCPSPSPQTLIPVTPPACSNCKSRPVAPNPVTGQYFDYCSKACATRAKNPGPNQSGRQASTLCGQCKRRPRFRNGTKVHAYCGRTCAKLAANNGSAPANPPIPNLAPSQPASSGPICQTPGCALPVFVHRNGTPSNFCMVAHKEWGEDRCINCRAVSRSDTSVMCQPCHDTALSMAPVIIEVPEDHKDYKRVEEQFRRSWRHNTACPEVTAVYRIIVTEASMNQYQQYLDNVEATGNFVALGKPRGNEHRRWHGTKRKCNLGDPGNKTFCTDLECSLCCIIKTSFDLKVFKAATGWGRFGRGIYTSFTSSKSNDYSKNVGINSEWKAMLLNKVVVGSCKRLNQDDNSLTEPPSGYNSVLAEAVPGGALNYDELVVYKNEAVRPSYLVMYQGP